MTIPPSIFCDTSVLYSALISSKGYAWQLLVLCSQGKIKLIANEYVLQELQFTLQQNREGIVDIYRALLIDLAHLRVVDDPTEQDVARLDYVSDPADRLVVAGAQRSQADYFVTYDRKHLLEDDDFRRRSGLRVVTPSDVVTELLDLSEE